MYKPRNVFVCLGIILLNSVGCAENSEMTPDSVVERPVDNRVRVRVATYNVHNLFDTVCDTGSCGGGSYETAYSQKQYDAKVGNVAKGIWTIDADIVLLQEIEKESGLLDVRRSLSETVYPGYAFGEIGRAASVDVGILTRGRVDAVYRYRTLGSFVYGGAAKQLSRELLAAEITLPGGIEVTAFTTHLISKVSDPGGGRRELEAAYVRDVIDGYAAEHPGRFIVFGGDLNDTPESASIQILDGSAVLVRDTAGREELEIATYGGKSALDHLYHNREASGALSGTERICGVTVASGLSGSDHCALKSTYYFERAGEDG